MSSVALAGVKLRLVPRTAEKNRRENRPQEPLRRERGGQRYCSPSLHQAAKRSHRREREWAAGGWLAFQLGDTPGATNAAAMKWGEERGKGGQVKKREIKFYGKKLAARERGRARESEGEIDREI